MKEPQCWILTAIGVFQFFATGMAALAGLTLLCPGTVLDKAWSLNPAAYAQLSPVASKAGVLFLALAGVLAAAAVGWFRRSRWGWMLTVAVIATQLVGDFVNAITGRYWEGAVGVVIAGVLLSYLLRPLVREAFDPQNREAKR